MIAAGLAGALIALAVAATAAPALAGAAAPPVRPQPLPPLAPDMTTSDILVETLIVWGLTHVFGIVGDGINPLTESLRKLRDQIALVTVRHKELATFARGTRRGGAGRAG